MRPLASLVVSIFGLSVAIAQAPKGADQFFGAAGDTFNDKTLKLPPVKPAAAGAPPAVFAGDGLLPPKPVNPWSGHFEVGTNGATGNSELFNVRVGLSGRRKTADSLTDLDLVYQYGLQSQTVIQNQALFNARQEMSIQGSKVSAFLSNNTEFDDLRAYRVRVGAYGGFGYSLIDQDDINWRVRAGAGVVRLIGKPEDRWVTEGVFGTDLSYQFNDRHSLVSSADYYPRLDNWSEYRVRVRAAYQFVIDQQSCTILRIGIQDRYDSVPGVGSRNNDLTYFASLGFKF